MQQQEKRRDLGKKALDEVLLIEEACPVQLFPACLTFVSVQSSSLAESWHKTFEEASSSCLERVFSHFEFSF